LFLTGSFPMENDRIAETVVGTSQAQSKMHRNT
ncbi:unnamed protein product, partial [marine sediment metagenome]